MERAELQRRAISGSFWTAAHTVISVPIAFAVNAVVARVLGPAEYGGLAFLMLVLAIATQVSNAGVSDATIQWGVASAVRGKHEEVARVVAGSLGYHVLVQLPLLAATVVLLARQNGAVAAVLVLAVALPCVFGSAALMISIENRTAMGAKLAMLSNLLVQAGILISAVTTESPTWVWAVRTLAGSLLLPLNLLVLDRWGRSVARQIRLPRKAPQGFWRFGLLTMATGLVSLLVFSRSEIIFLQWFDDAAAVGLFALAFGVAAQLTAPVDALMGPLIPAIAGLVAAHPDQVDRGRERALRAASFLSGCILAGVVPTLVTLLPSVYGEDFADARVAFFVLAIASSLQSVCNPIIAFQTARRRAGLLLRINVGALIVDVILAVALIPAFGLLGALVANVSAQLVVFVWLVIGEATERGQSPLSIVRPMSAWPVGLVAALAALILPSWIGLPMAASVPTALVMGLLIYVLGVRTMRAGMLDSDWLALAAALPMPLQPLVRASARLFGVTICSERLVSLEERRSSAIRYGVRTGASHEHLDCFAASSLRAWQTAPRRSRIARCTLDRILGHG